MFGDLFIIGFFFGNGVMYGGCWLCLGDVIESEVIYLGWQCNDVVVEQIGGCIFNFGLFVINW